MSSEVFFGIHKFAFSFCHFHSPIADVEGAAKRGLPKQSECFEREIGLI